MHHMIVQTMEQHLAGFETTMEEDEEILKGDVDWTTQCIVTFRRNEKAVAKWFIESSKLIIDIMQMSLEDAKTAVKTVPAKYEGVSIYIVLTVFKLIKAESEAKWLFRRKEKKRGKF